MDGGAWCAAVHGVTEGRTWLSDFTFTFHFHALEKEMATHSSVLAWRIPGTGEPWWAAVYGVAQSRTRLKWQQHQQPANYLGLFSKSAAFVFCSGSNINHCIKLKFSLKHSTNYLGRNKRKIIFLPHLSSEYVLFPHDDFRGRSFQQSLQVTIPGANGLMCHDLEWPHSSERSRPSSSHLSLVPGECGTFCDYIGIHLTSSFQTDNPVTLWACHQQPKPSLLGPVKLSSYPYLGQSWI